MMEQVNENINLEVGGLLIGRVVGDTLLIEDAVSGEIETSTVHVAIPPETIARVADDILNGRLTGNVIGWYHSHVFGGVFMSETDIETQRHLQQFSPFMTAIVIDSKTGNFGLFRLDRDRSVIHQLPQTRIAIGEPEKEADIPQRTSRQPTRRLLVSSLILGSLLLHVFQLSIVGLPLLPIGLIAGIKPGLPSREADSRMFDYSGGERTG